MARRAWHGSGVGSGACLINTPCDDLELQSLRVQLITNLNILNNMSFGKEAGAALVFGILYAGMFVYMTFMYATKRYRWSSRFTILYFHCLIRVASQACGVAFGVLVWDNTDVFVAYLILGAEGYFSLVSRSIRKRLVLLRVR